MKLLRLGAVGALAAAVAAAPMSRADAQTVWTSWTAFTAGQTTGTATGTNSPYGAATSTISGSVNVVEKVSATAFFHWNGTNDFLTK